MLKVNQILLVDYDVSVVDSEEKLNMFVPEVAKV